jgi:hypothetical protein
MMTTIEMLSETPSYHPFITIMVMTLPITMVTQIMESVEVIMLPVAISRTM